MENRQKAALRVALIYSAAGALWILVTDSLLDQIAAEKEMMKYITLIKDILFVIVSGIIVYFLVHNVLKRLMKAEQDLMETNREMAQSREEISSSYEQLLKLKMKLHELAYYDQLTGLRNQASLKEDVQKAVEKGDKFAVVLIDIDNFKYVNDALGYSIGHLIIKEISRKLAGMAEENCDLYRLSGDKFIILVNGIDNIFDVEEYTLRILKSFKEPVIVEDKPFYHTVSIGVSMYPEHGNSMDDLLKCAEIAMFKAKDAGKGRIVIYREPMESSVREWIDTEKYLRTALEKNEFELYFQPQYCVTTGTISGFEALIRWRNDEKGFVMPARFLKVAEDTHMIVPIGEWILRNTCIFIKRLRQEGFSDLTVSVNISRMQLLQEDFAESVMDIIEMSGIDPQNLEIEIPESIIVEYYDTVSERLKMLRANGVKIALDNFGKSYSAINYLRMLPITSVKIDRAYADIISYSEESRILTDFMLKTVKGAGLHVVCEGVETQEQFDYLVDHGCDKIQGYYICRPLPEKEAVLKLKSSNGALPDEE